DCMVSLLLASRSGLSFGIRSLHRSTLVRNHRLCRSFPPRSWRGKRLEFFPLHADLDHVWASVIVVVQLLAMHAVDALIDVDLPFRMDCLNGALLCAALARRTAFGPSLEPFEHSDPARYGEGSAKRTEIAAV